MLLRARVVYPVASPPIFDGGVLIAGQRIVAVGPWDALSAHHTGATRDLGEVILMPGLVNSHCHLDYTEILGEPPPKRFPDWIKGLMARKGGTGYSDYSRAWLSGAQMLLRTGTTTVADIEAVPELLPEVWTSTPLRVISFLEMTGVQSKRDPAAILGEAANKVKSLPSGRSRAGLSPHAPYSTTPALLRLTAEWAAHEKIPITMHVAESREEFEMFTQGEGHLFDWLKGQRDMSDCGQGTPLAHVFASGLMNEQFLAVHANYLQRSDIECLASTHASVVHCPRSHAYFRHQPFPFEQLTAAHINVCLGTDSLASVLPSGASLELNMFAEMQSFAAAHPTVEPREILRAATMNGARALGMARQVGELTPGAWADLIAVPYDGPFHDFESALIHHSGPVAFSMIDGIPV